MGIDINSLPLNMQRQALKILEEQAKHKETPEGKILICGWPQTKANPPMPSVKPLKGSKYHNIPTESKGITFDSAKEARRYNELLLMLKAGTITDLRLQVNFTLQEGFTTPDGTRIKPIVYKADFTYYRKGVLVVEDVKSRPTKTKTYLMKKKMLRDKFGIEIEEV